MRKVAKRMILLTTARTFDRWAANVAEAKEHRHKVSLALRRWQRRALSAVVNRWCTMVDERVLCRMVMNKIIKRYLLGAQSRVLVSWRAFVVAAQDGEIEHERHERVVLRCAKRMSQLTIARTFDRWAATATAQKEQRHRVRISLVRWQKRHLASCCASWIAFVDRRCLCRRVIAKVASRGNRCLLQGFSKWKDGVLRGAVERVTLQGAANALVVQWRSAVKGRLRAALGTWKRSVTHTTHAVHISTQRQRITVLARHHRSFVLGVVLSRRHFRVYHNVWNERQRVWEIADVAQMTTQ